LENELVTSLIVSGLGIVLLFFALVVLYALMYAMPSVFRDAPLTPEPEKPDEAQAPAGKGEMLRAAAIAVAVARAAQETSLPGSTVAGGGTSADPVSPWWSLHHDRQLNRKPISRRAQ
jgi:Na+-transporting methylmalonyl-CoA/oxaloacetate decarboxylase gamma subunit